MARQERRVRPGDVANSYVRWILGELGALLGGLSNEEWARTLEYFENCCAYTGVRLEPAQVDRDHAIPLNAEHGGLHMFGNVLPTAKSANAEKHSRHYRDFVQDAERLRRIEQFMKESGYAGRVAKLKELSKFCQTEYQRINALCGETRERLASLFPGGLPARAVVAPRTLSALPTAGGHAGIAAPADHQLRTTGSVLPIILEPASEPAFRSAVLAQGRAWITVEFRDGRRTVAEWRMPKLNKDSRILSNLRSRPEFRQGHWQANGIARVRVTVDRPRSP